LIEVRTDSQARKKIVAELRTFIIKIKQLRKITLKKNKIKNTTLKKLKKR